MTDRRAAAALICGSALATLLLGCGRSEREASSSSAEQVSAAPAAAASAAATPRAPVTLPDLSHMTPSVQQQIRDRDAAIARATQSGNGAELAAAYGEMGRLLLAAQSLDASARYFERALALAPDDHRWPYYLGHLARTSGALVQASAHFERALALQSGDMATRLRLAEVYLSQGAIDKAARLFEQVRAGQPDSAAALFGLGRASLAQGAHADAVTHLEQALALEPRAAAIHYPLSLAYRELGNVAMADEHLHRRQEGTVPFTEPLIQQLDELLDSPAAYESRGLRALDAGDWSAAAEQFRKGLALAPQDPSLGHRLGTALFMMGDTAAARREFERVVEASPTFARAHYSLGVMLETDGRPADAIGRLKEAVRLEPAYIEARLRLASVLGKTGRIADALAQYGAVLDVDPRIAGARYAQAIALARLQRYADARDVLREGRRLHPDQPSFALGLARVLAAAPDDRVRNGAEARTVLDALSDADRASDAGETVAMVLAELAIFDGAQAWQRRAIDAATQAGRRDVATRMREQLKEYERGEPSRIPWRADELP
jgi:tetratricopeptide (TPR) repeat protein